MRGQDVGEEEEDLRERFVHEIAGRILIVLFVVDDNDIFLLIVLRVFLFVVVRVCLDRSLPAATRTARRLVG